MRQLPSGWCRARVSELGDVRLGRQRSPDRAHGLHMRPYMRAANVTWAGLNVDDAKEMDFSPEEYEVFALRRGDVLVGEASGSRLEVGKSAVWRDEVPGACFQNTLIRVRTSQAMLPEYLQRHLQHDALRGALAEGARGIGIYHLGAAGLAQWEIAVPPLPEQERIVQKLDSLLMVVDACRQRLDRVPGILKRFRLSVLAAATTGELTREWREERGAVREWPTVLLGDLLTDVRYGTAQKCAYQPRAIPVLRIPNVADGIISHDDLKYAVFDDAERAKLELTPGDVLVIRSNGSLGLVGRAAVVTEREAGFLYAGYLIRLRLNHARARPGYVARYLESPACRSIIERTARSTTGVNNLNAEEIRRLMIPVPSLAEQDEIIRRAKELLDQADQVDRRVARAVAALERAVPAVLGKAFRGELVPQDPNDEPASVMLERIRAQQSATNDESTLPSGRRRSRAKPRARPQGAPRNKRRAS